MTEESTNLRRKWLAMLARLTAPQDAIEAGKALAAMVPLLRDMDDAMFNMDSLEFVARSSPKRAPNYGDLRSLMDAYAQSIKSKQTYGNARARWEAFMAQPRDERPVYTWTEEEKAQKREEERAEAASDWGNPQIVMRSARSLEGHPLRGHLGRMLAGLIKRHAPQNLQYLPPEFLLERKA